MKRLSIALCAAAIAAAAATARAEDPICAVAAERIVMSMEAEAAPGTPLALYIANPANREATLRDILAELEGTPERCEFIFNLPDGTAAAIARRAARASASASAAE
jgi:hypothetical protein